MALAPEAIESQKNDFVTGIMQGLNITEALKASGMAPGSLYLWAEQDTRLRTALAYADGARRVELIRDLDDIVDHPERYDDALKRPAWANLRMFRTKALMPEYRDNFKVEVNVGMAVGAGDWQAAITAISAAKDAPARY